MFLSSKKTCLNTSLDDALNAIFEMLKLSMQRKALVRRGINPVTMEKLSSEVKETLKRFECRRKIMLDFIFQECCLPANEERIFFQIIFAAFDTFYPLDFQGNYHPEKETVFQAKVFECVNHINTQCLNEASFDEIRNDVREYLKYFSSLEAYGIFLEKLTDLSTWPIAS